MRNTFLEDFQASEPTFSVDSLPLESLLLKQSSFWYRRRESQVICYADAQKKNQAALEVWQKRSKGKQRGAPT